MDSSECVQVGTEDRHVSVLEKNVYMSAAFDVSRSRT